MDEPEAQTVTVTPLFQPRGAQIEALYALADSRAEGATKALVQAATGIGKTYLAAFDSVSYEKILFVAHREEILKQAARSFRNVRHSDDYGFFDRNQKNTQQSVIFASVATLGKPEYLNERYFVPDFFDYIVIDEFHHAVTKSYQNIVSYFTPKFCWVSRQPRNVWTARTFTRFAITMCPMRFRCRKPSTRECWYRFITMAFMMKPTIPAPSG